MSSIRSYSKNLRRNLPVKKRVNKNNKNLNSIINDYRRLLVLNFLWVLPYLPCHLFDKFPEKNIHFWKFLILLFKVIKILLALVTLIYSNLIFPTNKPLALTYNLFAIFGLVASWWMFFGRQRVLKSIQMLLVLTSQVTPRKVKSKWNVYLHVIFSVIGSTVFSVSTSMTAVQTYHIMNVTSSSFLWYVITEEYERMVSMSLVIVGVLDFIFCAIVCVVTMLLSSTVYFHVGDILMNFGTKLKKRFEYRAINKHSLSESLLMFEKITELVNAVDEAFSVSVLCVYGAMMTIFFIGICVIRSYDISDASVIILLVSIFSFAIYCFFSLTVTGDRIARKHVELREMLVSCSNVTVGSEHCEKTIACFTLMTSEMRSAELYVTGGEVFTICNDLILSVAGAMITYGVLIIQID